MTVIATAALAAIGVYLAMRWLAALYLLLDLRYMWGMAWPRMARAIAIWSLLPVILMLSLGELRAAFLGGFAGYVVYYVVVALTLSEVLIPRLLTRRD